MHRGRIFGVVMLIGVFAVTSMVLLVSAFGQQIKADAWYTTRAVSAGEVYSPDNVEHRSIVLRGAQVNLGVLASKPYGQRASRNLAGGLPLREDDILARDIASVGIKVNLAPPLVTGDIVNVYSITGNSARMIGRGVTIDRPPGGDRVATVFVPGREELSWAAVSASSTQLMMIKSSAAAGKLGDQISLDDAIKAITAADANITVVPQLVDPGAKAASPAPSATPKR